MPAVPSTDHAKGFSLTGATSSFSGNLKTFNWSGTSRASINTTHTGTATADTHQPSDRVDYGTIEVSGNYIPDTVPAIKAAAETWTLTFPTADGQVTPVSIAFTGFMIEFEASGDIGDDGLMPFSATLKISGDITHTPSSDT